MKKKKKLETIKISIKPEDLHGSLTHTLKLMKSKIYLEKKLKRNPMLLLTLLTNILTLMELWSLNTLKNKWMNWLKIMREQIKFMLNPQKEELNMMNPYKSYFGFRFTTKEAHKNSHLNKEILKLTNWEHFLSPEKIMTLELWILPFHY